MNYDYILFSLFSSFGLVASIMVITLSNAVYSVLFLIFLFCNIVSLLLLIGAEFLSLMFLIVYIGAIAVLFLFVVMMLNIKTKTFNTVSYFSILPIGIFVVLISTLQFFISLTSNFATSYNYENTNSWVSWVSENNSYTNIEALGYVLYTKYSFIFLLCSLLLLVSMIGVIVLTINQRREVKKQNINSQISRHFKKTVKFIKL